MLGMGGGINRRTQVWKRRSKIVPCFNINHIKVGVEVSLTSSHNDFITQYVCKGSRNRKLNNIHGVKALLKSLTGKPTSDLP